MAIIFQYGSNTDTARLNADDRLKGQARCIGLASTVEPHEFRLGVPSDKYQCTATIEPGGGESVWGVLYEIPDHLVKRDTKTPRRWKSLDEIEAEGRNTRRITIRVRKVHGEEVPAITYVGIKTQKGLRTKVEYASHILRGLISNGAPAEYIHRVRDVIIENNPDIESEILSQAQQQQ